MTETVTGTATTADVIALAPDETGELCVLLGLRDIASDAFPGYQALPGGFRDDGEHTATTATRETREETGAELAEADLTPVGHYAAPGRDPRGEVSSDAYLVRLEAAVAVEGRDDLDEARWVPVETALEMTLAFDHNVILWDALHQET